MRLLRVFDYKAPVAARRMRYRNRVSGWLETSDQVVEVDWDDFGGVDLDRFRDMWVSEDIADCEDD